MKRWLKAMLAALLLIAVSWWLWRAWQAPYAELARELQALRKAGEPLRYEDIIPPVPSNLNAAPIYEQAFKAIAKLTHAETMQIDANYRRITDPEQVRKLLARYRSVLLLAKRASRYPHLRLVHLAPNFVSTEFWHPSKIRTLARLLSTEAMYHLHMGNTDGAWDNVAVLLRMMKQLSQEPFVMHAMSICILRQLVQVAQKGEPYNWQVFEAMDEAAKRITKQGVTLGSFAFRPLEIAGMFLRVEGLVTEDAGSGSSFRTTATMKAHQRILQVVLAAYLYRHERGQFPNNLEALVPRYLPAVPQDPFDGQPLRYRWENGALRLWSVGSDLKDGEKDIVWTIQP